MILKVLRAMNVCSSLSSHYAGIGNEYKFSLLLPLPSHLAFVQTFDVDKYSLQHGYHVAFARVVHSL
jgi:hypothetical protein